MDLNVQEQSSVQNGLEAVRGFGGALLQLRLVRAEARNPLTPELVRDLTAHIAAAERDGVRLLVLGAMGTHFCSGMDLTSAAADPAATDGTAFWELLTRLQESGMMVAAAVDGAVAGGGVGLVAACDVVLATPRATFALPEALWGLLPCCVVPFLQERVGPAVARRMTLLTTPIDAEEALRVGLVDDLVPNLDDAVRQLALRVRRIDPRTHARAVGFLASLPATRQDARGFALDELVRVAGSELVRSNLTRFAKTGAYPWESQ